MLLHYNRSIKFLISRMLQFDSIFFIGITINLERHLNGVEAGNAGASGRLWQPPQQQQSSNTSYINNPDIEILLPSVDEIASAFKQLKSNKSAGSDELAAELFKMGPERLTIEMH